jgi:hypoxanthine phosphoribosyltransferase
MDSITVKDKSFRPYISEVEINTSVALLAQQINQDYIGKKPLFVGILNGSFMFFSDLLKAIHIECTVSFVKLASYEGLQTTGAVTELIGLNEEISGRDIVLVEDIVDTGNTLVKLFDILTDKNPKSIKIATLLFKPSAYRQTYPLDYVGKEIPNDFVLGYGLDYDGLGRNLSSIYVLNE